MTSPSDRPAGYVPALRFDRLTALYDPVVAVTTRERRFKRMLLNQCDLGAANRLLDLGCGTGTLAVLAAQEAPHLEVVGIDGDDAILDRARAKAHDARVEITFRRGLAHELPADDAAFDRVISTLFFHHLDTTTKAAAFVEIRRVLAPGGELHLADWGTPGGPLTRLASWPLRLFDGVENTRDNVQGRLPSLMTEAGLREVRTTGSPPTVFGTMALHAAVAPDGPTGRPHPT